MFISLCFTSSLSVLSNFWAAALGTWLTVGLEVMRTGVLGRISGGIRPGDTGLRYGLKAAAAAAAALALVARPGVIENMGCTTA